MDLSGGWLLRLGATGALLALLVLGHVVADFIAQTDAMVRNKRRPGALLAHGGIVALVHAAFLAPFATPRTLIVLVALAALHLLVDSAKVRIEPRTRMKATVFLVDQAAHLLLIVAAWRLLIALDWWMPRPLPVTPAVLSASAVLLASFAFAWNGGAAAVRELLRSRGNDPFQTPNNMGKLIGCLERWIVIALVLLDQWAAIAFVFAAKSIARFKQIEDRSFAEYYLVGTLASILVGAGIGLGARWALGW